MSSPAGWFPDPSDASRQRYFDGQQWTDSYAPYATAPPPPGASSGPTPAKSTSAIGWWRGLSRWQRRLISGGIAVFAVLFAIGQIVGDDRSASTATVSTTSSSAQPVSTTEAAAPTAAAPPASETPTTPSFTSEEYQESAVSTCQDAIKQGLKDPDSAKFSDDWKAWEITAPNSKPPEGMTYNPAAGDLFYNAGGSVNAKNGFGGYVGAEPYYCDVVITTDGNTHARAHSLADALNPPG